MPAFISLLLVSLRYRYDKTSDVFRIFCLLGFKQSSTKETSCSFFSKSWGISNLISLIASVLFPLSPLLLITLPLTPEDQTMFPFEWSQLLNTSPYTHLFFFFLQDFNSLIIHSKKLTSPVVKMHLTRFPKSSRQKNVQGNCFVPLWPGSQEVWSLINGS